MGNTCCKKPEEELVLETFDSTANNNMETNDSNRFTFSKDKYPHDSDSAFKPRKLEELKENIEPVINAIDEEEPRNENENENKNGKENINDFEIENPKENGMENGNEMGMENGNENQ